MDLIHIGHHKCGSTFLQYEVFPKLPALKVFTELELEKDPKLRENILAFCRAANLYYDPQIERELAESWKEFNALAYEGFVGHGWESTAGYHLEPVARRLNRIYPEAKVLIVIREQASFLRSWYLGDVMVGVIGRFEYWFKRKRENQLLDWIKYAPIIELYQNLFGKDNVVVETFEGLFSHHSLNGMLNRLGIDSEGLDQVKTDRIVNRGQSVPRYYLTRLANRFFGGKHNYGNGRLYNYWRRYSQVIDRVAFGLGGKKPSPSFPGFEDAVADLYHADNSRTSELLGKNLRELGYV